MSDILTAPAAAPHALTASPLETLRDVGVLMKPRIAMMAGIVAAAAMAMAPGSLGARDAVLALLGILMSVAGAGALNMLIERDVDALMKRTASRPLPAGRLHPMWALAVGGLLSAVSLPLLWSVASPLTSALTAFSLFVYVLVYTPMKRTSPWSLVVGSVPGAMPALMGSSAVTGAFDTVGLALFGIVFLWQLPHFIAISVYRDREFAAAGHKTVAGRWGLNAARASIVGTTVLLALLGVALWPLGLGGLPYGIIAAAAGAWFVSVSLRGAFGNPNAWARRVFLASLVYLTVVFVGLGADALLAGALARLQG